MKGINKIYVSAAMAIGALGAVSCSTISNTATTVGVSNEIVNLTVAETTVAEHKATKTTEWKWTPFSAVNLDAVKNRATALLLDETGADVLVEPRYEVKQRGFMRGGSLTVTGYPATYTGFHPMTENEATAINKLRFPTIYAGGEVTQLGGQKSKKSNTPFVARRHKKVFEGYSSLAVNLGYGISDFDGKGVDVGLMYSHIGNNAWGWFTKLNLITLSKSHDMGYHYDYETKSATGYGASIEFGAMKAFSNTTALYLGTGFAIAPNLDDDYYLWEYDSDEIYSNFNNGCIPVDLGVQFKFGSINAQLGVKALLSVSDYDNIYTPYVGIGYAF